MNHLLVKLCICFKSLTHVAYAYKNQCYQGSYQLDLGLPSGVRFYKILIIGNLLIQDKRKELSDE